MAREHQAEPLGVCRCPRAQRACEARELTASREPRHTTASREVSGEISRCGVGDQSHQGVAVSDVLVERGGFHTHRLCDRLHREPR